MVRHKPGRPRDSRLLDERSEQIIQHVISRHYAKRESESKASIVERVRLIAKRLQLPPPCRKTVLSRIRAQESFALDVKRKGGEIARQRWQLRRGKLVVDQPLDLLQIDHTLSDLLVVSPEGTVIGRPWLTLAIDVATRVVAGYYLSMDAPSSISVAMCIAHTLSPKLESRDHPDLWPVYGTWRRILVDNGKDFRSQALVRGCEQHGIELTWRPVHRPHYGAHIERLMGTFMRKVHTLPGTTFSNSRQRGDYPSERKACMTLEDFRVWLVETICRGYHVRKHKGIGTAPLLAWEHGLCPADGAQAMPIVPVDIIHLRRDFYPFVDRRLQRTGVQWRGSRYWNDDLAASYYPGAMVKVHYDPRDPSRVWVRMEGDRLIECLVVAGHALGEGKTIPNSPQEQARLDYIMAAGYDISDEVVEQAQRHQRASRKENHRVVTPVGKGKRGGRQAHFTEHEEIHVHPPVPLTGAPALVEVFES